MNQVCKLERMQNELKIHYKERKQIYEQIYAKSPNRALVLANVYMNIKYMGNKYPQTLEDELFGYVP